MHAARSAGTVVSYDVNLRSSLWLDGGRDPVTVNRRMLEQVDVAFGSIEDYRTGLGFEIEDRPVEGWVDEPEHFATLAEAVRADFPNVQVVAMSLRDSRSAGFNHWGGVLEVDGTAHGGRFHRNLEVYDRVGGGDGFVSGVVWSLLDGRTPEEYRKRLDSIAHLSHVSVEVHPCEDEDCVCTSGSQGNFPNP